MDAFCHASVIRTFQLSEYTPVPTRSDKWPPTVSDFRVSNLPPVCLCMLSMFSPTTFSQILGIVLWIKVVVPVLSTSLHTHDRLLMVYTLTWQCWLVYSSCELHTYTQASLFFFVHLHLTSRHIDFMTKDSVTYLRLRDIMGCGILPRLTDTEMVYTLQNMVREALSVHTKQELITLYERLCMHGPMFWMTSMTKIVVGNV